MIQQPYAKGALGNFAIESSVICVASSGLTEEPEGARRFIEKVALVELSFVRLCKERPFENGGLHSQLAPVLD